MARRAETKQGEVAAPYRERILYGELTPGTKLPSEKELRTEFGASQPTVREAMKMLEEEGLVESRAGAGYYVLAPGAPVGLRLDPPGLREPERLFAIAGPAGNVSRTGFDSTAPATVAWAELLDVEVRTPVVLRGFVELVNDTPLLMSRSYLPAWLADEPPAVNPAPQDLAIGRLALVGRDVTPDEAYICARPPSREVATTLGIGRGVSTLVITTRWLVDRPDGPPVRAAVEVICRGVPARLTLPLDLLVRGLSSGA